MGLVRGLLIMFASRLCCRTSRKHICIFMSTCMSCRDPYRKGKHMLIFLMVFFVLLVAFSKFVRGFLVLGEAALAANCITASRSNQGGSASSRELDHGLKT